MLRHAAALAAAILCALPGRAGAQRAIAVGQELQGTLTAADPVLDDDSHYELYRIRLRAGQVVSVLLSSRDFDAYLAVGPGTLGDECGDCVTDDDGAGGTDARVVYVAPEGGDHTIRVNTLSAGETGQYTLRVEERGLEGALRVDTSASGELASGDLTLEDGAFADVWSFTPERDGRYVLELRSASFDAFLSVGWFAEGSWTELESDDDAAGGTDARVEVVLRAGVSYRVRAGSLGEGGTGSYTLTVAH